MISNSSWHLWDSSGSGQNHKDYPSMVTCDGVGADGEVEDINDDIDGDIIIILVTDNCGIIPELVETTRAELSN